MKQEIARDKSRGNVKLPVSHLAFSEIPGQSSLFLEYLKDPSALRLFYPNAVASYVELNRYAPQALANYRTGRNALCNSLEAINESVEAGKATSDNIASLREAGTVAVVTGQQAGLFSGPLYTIYKALSAIKLANELSQSGVKAVPVFWAATEDHDFAEVSEASFLSRSGEVLESKYVPNGYVENVAVGKVGIDAGIEPLVDNIFYELPHTEFSDEMKALLSDCWSPGSTFGTAFLRTLAKLFDRYGLIFLDPQDLGLKHLSAPIYSEAVNAADQIVANLTSRSRELESKGFHSQVLIDDDYFPLFWHDNDGRRTALRKINDGTYRAKGSNRQFAGSELADLAANEPERFSPGVMLRPVVQDYLLPTICYIGGGAEIAYFAQNSEVYRVLGRPVTPIVHRQSFTVIENNQQRILDKLGLDVKELFADKDALRIGLAEKGFAVETAGIFSEVEKNMIAEMDRLDQAISQIDVTVAANLATRRRKILYHIATLRRKTLLAQTRNDAVAGRQLDGVCSALFPKGALQERSLNVFTYFNKFGMNFIDWIYEAIDLDDKDHRIIEL